nr:MAG TPA: hypothetical protein [Caudoviricetes sp.]
MTEYKTPRIDEVLGVLFMPFKLGPSYHSYPQFLQ